MTPIFFGNFQFYSPLLIRYNFIAVIRYLSVVKDLENGGSDLVVLFFKKTLEMTRGDLRLFFILPFLLHWNTEEQFILSKLFDIFDCRKNLFWDAISFVAKKMKKPQYYVNSLDMDVKRWTDRKYFDLKKITTFYQFILYLNLIINWIIINLYMAYTVHYSSN